MVCRVFDPAVCGRGYPAAITSPCPVSAPGRGFFRFDAPVARRVPGQHLHFSAADEVDMVRRPVFAAEHRIRADGNMKCPRHFLVQQRVSAQVHLCILQLVSEHDRLAGEYVQDRVELRKQAKVPLIKAALLRARKDLPVDGPRLLQNNRRGAQRGNGGGKLIGDGLVGVFAPELDQNQLSGRNAACFYDFCYGFARHTHTSSVSAIPSCSHRNVKSDLINIKINNQDPLRDK